MDAVFRCNFSLGSGVFAYSHHLFGRQLAPLIALIRDPEFMAVLHRHIMQIGFIVSNEEMIGVDAFPVITAVADKHP